MHKESEHISRQKEKLSSWILDYDKNAYCDPKINEESRELLVDSFNECSDLRKSFHNSLNQFFSNLGFSSMDNIHKFDNSFTNFEFALHDKRQNSIGLDLGLSKFKNNSISKFNTKKEGMLNSKKKIKDKNKIKNNISLKKKFFKQEFENSKENSVDYNDKRFFYINKNNEEVIESDNEDSDDKKNVKYKKNINIKKEEEKNEQNGDYFLNSIYNQFGISKNKFLNKEVEDENVKYTKEKNKIIIQEEKNKYNEKIPKTKSDDKNMMISLLDKEKKEKIKDKINKKYDNKIKIDNKYIFEDKKITKKIDETKIKDKKSENDKLKINKFEKEKEQYMHTRKNKKR